MGDLNQRHFLQKYVPAVSGPVLEIGSHDYGNTASFRDVYAQHEYVGVDLKAGPNVDKVADLTKGVGDLQEDYFALAICCSVMEHTPKPWLMAENIARLVRPGGLLYISVPWVWAFHAFPDDYYRFSFKAIPVLFENFEWSAPYYSTNVEGEIIKLKPDGEGVDYPFLQKVPLEDGKYRKYLPYIMVNMLGTRRA
jgi:SAM-dependent methyltransferase